MDKIPVRLLLAIALSAGGCITPLPPAAHDADDPGQLSSADQAAHVPGLRPCTRDAGRTLHIDSRQPVNILVYGHNGYAANFYELAEALALHGQQTVCFEYNERDSLMRVSSQLVTAVNRLAQHLNSPKMTVIGHSLGGLVARKALIEDRPDPVRNVNVDLQLVTVSAPFSGVASARRCAIPALRVATLGLLDLVCWLISGDKWHEITPASAFIRQPGKLAPQVHRHLMVVTDERGSCRTRTATGRCIKDDYVFGVAEQQYPPVANAPRTTVASVIAGHREIIGKPGITPNKLIDVLAREGMVVPRSSSSAGRATVESRP